MDEACEGGMRGSGTASAGVRFQSDHTEHINEMYGTCNMYDMYTYEHTLYTCLPRAGGIATPHAHATAVVIVIEMQGVFNTSIFQHTSATPAAAAEVGSRVPCSRCMGSGSDSDSGSGSGSGSGTSVKHPSRALLVLVLELVLTHTSSISSSSR